MNFIRLCDVRLYRNIRGTHLYSANWYSSITWWIKFPPLAMIRQ